MLRTVCRWIHLTRSGHFQVLPVVTAVICQPDGILAVEQPELHVHPAVQVGIGDLLAASVERSGRRLANLSERSDGDPQ